MWAQGQTRLPHSPRWVTLGLGKHTPNSDEGLGRPWAHRRLLRVAGGICSCWWHSVTLGGCAPGQKTASSWLLACGSRLSSLHSQPESGSHPRPCLLRPPAQAMPSSPGSAPPLPALQTSSKRPVTFLPMESGQVSLAVPSADPGVGSAEWPLVASDTEEKLPPETEGGHCPMKGLLAVEGDNPCANTLGTYRRQKSPSPGGPGGLPGGGGPGMDEGQ